MLRNVINACRNIISVSLKAEIYFVLCVAHKQAVKSWKRKIARECILETSV